VPVLKVLENRAIMRGLAEDPGVGWYRRLQGLIEVWREELPETEPPEGVQYSFVDMRDTDELKVIGYSTIANKNGVLVVNWKK
jgi:hypothetical protein